ncbi:MAG: hypothetical protein D6694_04145 [Gammaproteobacteria bacterium]|nr:MAG: hypothetical protein D6694_04145 [Gammaproteobacteria bacterium]
MQQSAALKRVSAFIVAALLMVNASSFASAWQEESEASTAKMVVVATLSEQLYAEVYQSVRKVSLEAAAHMLSKSELMASMDWIKSVPPVSEAVVLMEPFSAKPVGVSE